MPKKSRNDTRNSKPFIEAVKNNPEVEVLELLKPNARTPNGTLINIYEVDLEWRATAVYWAAVLNRELLIRPLVAAGIEVDKPNKEHATPLCIAIYNAHFSTSFVCRGKRQS